MHRSVQGVYVFLAREGLLGVGSFAGDLHSGSVVELYCMGRLSCLGNGQCLLR